MKKIFIGIFVLLVVSALFFIPVNQEKAVSIKSPFLNLYSLLSNPQKWGKWRPDLKKAAQADSSKILIHKDTSAFSIKYGDLTIGVKKSGNLFDITETHHNKTVNYNYTLLPVDDKFMNKTQVMAAQKTNLVNYLADKIWPGSLGDTHINELKTYMETDSLLYGFNIFKTAVPEWFLIVGSKEVLKKDQFTAVAQIKAELDNYIKNNGVKKIRPLIAQFVPALKDSVKVKVGFYVDKKITSTKDISFNRMPKGGKLYAVKFKGQFIQRQNAYTALSQYFANHLYQPPILPFETYFDNKLPKSDTDRVNIQVNFSAPY